MASAALNSERLSSARLRYLREKGIGFFITQWWSHKCWKINYWWVTRGLPRVTRGILLLASKILNSPHKAKCIRSFMFILIKRSWKDSKLHWLLCIGSTTDGQRWSNFDGRTRSNDRIAATPGCFKIGYQISNWGIKN